MALAQLRFLRSGMIAQVYSQASTILLQLLTVPLLILFWGAEHFGVWLVLAAISTYATLADLGFVQAAASDMTIRIAAGDPDDALETFQSAQALVICVSLLIGVAACAALLALPLDVMLGVQAWASHGEVTTTLAILVVLVLLTIGFGVIGAGLRAVDLYPAMVTYGATARLAEGLAVLVTAAIGGGFVAAALSMIAMRTTVTALALIRLRRAAPWLQIGLAHASWRRAEHLFLPSVTFMAYTIGNLLSIQGTTVLIGTSLGPVAATTFTAMRTVSRLGITATNMINYPMQPEYSRMIGAGKRLEMRRLFRFHLIANSTLALAFLGAVLLFGHWIVTTWTHGKIEMQEPLFTLLNIAIGLEMLWSTLLSPLVSVNRHQISSTAFLVVSLAGLAVLWLLLPTSGLALAGVISLAVAAIMLVIVGGVLFLNRPWAGRQTI